MKTWEISATVIDVGVDGKPYSRSALKRELLRTLSRDLYLKVKDMTLIEFRGPVAVRKARKENT
jgi:hypothetical protein